MGRRTERVFDAVHEMLDDDEYLELGTISMEGMDSVNVEVTVYELSKEEESEYIENKRLELLDLLPDEVGLNVVVV